MTFAPIHPACRASVIIPARNEEQALPATLDALRLQREAAPTSYVVIALRNNRTDSSVALARTYQSRHSSFFALHIASATLPPERAYVGTARAMLMDCASSSLTASSPNKAQKLISLIGQ